jgi:hypothetical protein
MSFQIECSRCKTVLVTDESTRPVFYVKDDDGKVSLTVQPISADVPEGEKPFAHISCLKLWMLHWIDQDVSLVRAFGDAAKGMVTS